MMRGGGTDDRVWPLFGGLAELDRPLPGESSPALGWQRSGPPRWCSKATRLGAGKRRERERKREVRVGWLGLRPWGEVHGYIRSPRVLVMIEFEGTNP